MNATFVQRNIRWLITLWVAALLVASVPALTVIPTASATVTPASQQQAEGPRNGFGG